MAYVKNFLTTFVPHFVWVTFWQKCKPIAFLIGQKFRVKFLKYFGKNLSNMLFVSNFGKKGGP